MRKGIRDLVRIDKATLEGDFCHYARVLVDVDLASMVLETLWINRERKAFWIDLVYENMLAYCVTCSFIVHESYNYHKNK